MRRFRQILLLLGVCLLAGCGLESGGAVPLPVGPGSIKPVPELAGVPITVGSKDFSEQNTMGFIIEFALTAAGMTVRDMTNIQGSNSMRDAQLNGQIDIAFDYTGTGWINYLGNEKPVPGSQAQFEAVRAEDLEKHGMWWTDLAPVNNTYALVTNKKTADAKGIRTLSDYANLVRSDPGAAGTCLGTEFSVRQDGFPGMAAAYGIDVGQVHKQIVQDAVVFQATADGIQCNFGSVATTDGRIPSLGLQILDDDRHFFPQYNAALVMRKSYADAHPQVEQVLQPITELMTNETMTELNRQVDLEGREPADVARDWLVSKGFVTKP